LAFSLNQSRVDGLKGSKILTAKGAKKIRKGREDKIEARSWKPGARN
jgi:hypothetical protein